MKKREEPKHQLVYPGTELKARPGDVLYSHKISKSSMLVGHEGIVGEDCRIYHVNRWGKNGHADTLPAYLSRHLKKEKLTILRIEDTQAALLAARWAETHIHEVEAYSYSRRLTDIKRNYCSKFVWQAYFFGSEGRINLTGRRFTEKNRKFITPSQLFRNMENIGYFINE